MLNLIAAGAAIAILLQFSDLGAEIAAGCKAYAAENGTDDAGCDCIGEAAAEDPTLAEALAAIETEADVEGAPEPAKAAIAACFPAE